MRSFSLARPFAWVLVLLFVAITMPPRLKADTAGARPADHQSAGRLPHSGPDSKENSEPSEGALSACYSVGLTIVCCVGAHCQGRVSLSSRATEADTDPSMSMLPATQD